jgi:hypothetical protein
VERADVHATLRLARARSVARLDLKHAECHASKVLDPLFAPASPLAPSLTELRLGARCFVSFDALSSLQRCFVSLRALSIHLHSCSLFLNVLQHFPALQSLCIDEHSYTPVSTDGDADWTSDPSVHWDDEDGAHDVAPVGVAHRQAGVDDAVIACTSLTQLRLIDTSIDALLPIFLSPNARRLQSLTLERFALGDIPAAEWTNALSNLVSLQSLSLCRCDGVVRVLLYCITLHAPPTLRHLRLQFHGDNGAELPGALLASLTQMLEQRSELNISIEDLQSTRGHFTDHDWTTFSTQLQLLVTQFPERLHCTD